MTTSQGSTPGGYEKSDLSPKAISAFGLVLGVVVILAMLAAAWMFGFFASWRAAHDAPPSPLASASPGPPEPRLQVHAVTDMTALRTAEDNILSSYGWVSKEAGVARIPIDRAMQLVLERGLPVSKPAPATVSAKGGVR